MEVDAGSGHLTRELTKQLQMPRNAPKCNLFGWENASINEATPPFIVSCVQGWVRSNQLPPSIRSQGSAINMRDVDTFVFIRALKTNTASPSLFERAFKEIFSTPGLVSSIASKDELTKFGTHAAASYLVSQIPDESCPLVASWGPHTICRLIRWLTNKCSLSTSDFELYLEPFVARSKSGLYWNDFCNRLGLLPASNLSAAARMVFNRPRLDTTDVLLSLVEEKYNRVLRRDDHEGKENHQKPHLLDRIGIGKQPLVDRISSPRKPLLSRIEM
jgi:hypothetical protein